MFKRLINTLGLVVAGLFIGIVAYAQVPVSPTNTYNDLPGGIYTPVSSGSDVCPTISGTPSTKFFSVTVNTTDIGTTWFEWVVYGGTITDDNGNTGPANNASSASIGGIPYFYISDDNYSSGTSSTITVQWYTSDLSNAWVAVRQHSQWDCYEGPWRVYINNIFNQKPVFDNFPTDITIAFDDRLNFTLPLPAAHDADGCPNALTYNYVVDRPGTLTNLTGTNFTRSLAPDSLGVGVNTVTWTITDGMKDSIRSYTITVDKQPLITHVAWIDPTCAGGAYGSLYITDTLNYSFSPPLQYSHNGGSYSSARYYGSLPAGTHTIQARVTYNVDKDFNGSTEQTIQYSPVYSCALHDPAAKSVDAVPDTASVTRQPTCATSDDGYIYVDPSLMTPQNSSFVFNGSSDHINLNRYFNSEQSALSIATWIKVPAVSISSEAAIISFNNAQFFQLSVTQSSGGSQQSFVRFTTVNSSNVQDPLDWTNIKINDGEWHLVVATYNGGVKALYVDGVPLRRTLASTTFGSNSATSYGCIGARMVSSTFNATPAGNYFKGNMTDIGIWGSTIDSAGVVEIMKHGIAASGPSDYWVLNDLPAIVSPAQYANFSDIGNSANLNGWGRVYGGSLSANDAPVLYNWTPDAYPDTELDSIPSGSYTLSALDIMGCSSSAVSQTYTLTNDDQDPPMLMMNVALVNNTAQYGRVTQSGDGSNGCGSTPAHLAVDGNLDQAVADCSVSSTDGGTDEWWQIDLGAIYTIRQVRIFHADAGAPTNFYVMISQSLMSSLGDTTRSNVSYKHFSGTPTSVQTFNFNANNTRYLRINAVGSGALVLGEVEALSPRSSTFTRTLYLGSDDCTYVVGAYDGSIDPVAYDNCGVITQMYHDQTGLTYQNSLVGIEFPLIPTPTQVKWTVIDDSPDTTVLTVNYTVLDTIRPVFAPHGGSFRDTITWCKVTSGFKIPIPNATDNYNCSSSNPKYDFKSLRLRIDGSSVRLYDNITYTYDPTDDDDSLDIDQAYLSNGSSHRFLWELRDNSNLVRYDSFYVYVETKPYINELHSANISCYGLQDGIINLNNISSQSGETVTYNIRWATDTLSQSSPLFNTLAVGSYYAWIEVDGCKSSEYLNGSAITITQPEKIAPLFTISPVICFGDSGSIDSYLGATKLLLHLLGGTNNVISASNYSALELGASGSVEAWVYLDTLSAASTNSEAGIVNYVSGSGSYGLRMVGGNLSLVVGGTTLSAPSGSLPQREWHHVAGTWDATQRVLYIDGVVVGSAGAASNSATGGTLYIGCMGTGPENTNLHGFIRFARIWNRALTSAEMGANYRFASPINYNGSLVANYPMNINQGSQLINTYNGVSATLVTTNTEWQAYAFYWDGVVTPYYTRTEDLTDAPAQQYHYYIQAPYGCSWDSLITLPMTDKNPPTMIFYNEDKINVNVDQVMTRTTSQITSTVWVNPDLLNSITDCYYIAQGGEFDPVIDDHSCPASQVTVTWAIAATGETGSSTLNLRSFTDTTIVAWHAVDGADNFSNKTMLYRVRDNLAPVITWDDSTVYADPDECSYLVPNASTFVPTVTDNCLDGKLWNLYPGGGFTDNLNGINIPVGEHDITWIYLDQWGLGDTIVQHISVIDDQPPVANCLNATVNLDAAGEATIDSSLIDNNSGDNCNSLKNVQIIKNIAQDYEAVNGVEATDIFCSSGDLCTEGLAVDGNTGTLLSDCSSFVSTISNNPVWTIGYTSSSMMIYGIRIYNSALGSPLTGFDVMIATLPTFAAASIVWDTTYTGTAVSGSIYFSIPDGVVGKYLRIRLNGTNVQLGLAEVEIYGYPDGSDASTLDFDCDDVRYSGTAGVFNPITVLLRVIDQEDNYATCWSNVTVIDGTAPTVRTTNAKISIGSDGYAVITGAMIDSLSSDVCGIDTLWAVPDTFTCLDAGVQNVLLWARDVNGNENSAKARVVIQDVTGPVVTAKKNIELPLGNDGYYVIDPYTDLVQSVSDNCTATSDLLFTCDPDTVWCDDLGTIKVTLYVTDGSGSTTTVVVGDSISGIPDELVTVADKLPATAVLNEYSLKLGSDGTGIIYFSDLIPDANFHDNCSTIKNKQISYDYGKTWCDVPNEGSGSSSGNQNLSVDYASVTGSTAYSSTYSLAKSKDGSTSTAYISSDNTGQRYLKFSFAKRYLFDSTSVVWDSRILGAAINVGTTVEPPTGYVTGYSTYALTNVNNTDSTTTGDSYVTNTVPGYASTPAVYYIEYNFGTTPQVFVGTTARWASFNTSNPGSITVTTPISAYRSGGGGGTWNDRLPYVQVCTNTAGTAWTQVATFPAGTSQQGTFRYYTTSGGISGTSIPTTFTQTTGYRIRLYFYGNNTNRVGIADWKVYTRDVTQDCSLPTTAKVQYYNYTTSAWQDVPTAGTNIGVVASPTENKCKFSSTLNTDSFRLYFDNTTLTRRIGVEEWKLYGRNYYATTEPACIVYNCDSVDTYVTVMLKWEDLAGNVGRDTAQVYIESYFDITAVRIKDCGINHEAFFFQAEDMITGMPYSYSWISIDNPQVGIYSSSPSGPPSLTSSTDLNPYIYSSLAVNKDYNGQITVTDTMGCYDSFDFMFTTHPASGSDQSIVTTSDVCYMDTLILGAAEVPTYSQNGSTPVTIVWYNWDIPDYGDGNDNTGVFAVKDTLTLLTTGMVYHGPTDTVTVWMNKEFGTYATAGVDTTFVHYRRAGTDEYQTGGGGSPQYCYDELYFRIVVHYVDPPVLSSYSKLICPFDTVKYVVSPAEQAKFDHYAWTVSGAGRILQGGNYYDDSVTVVWNNTSLTPYIRIVGYNSLDCWDSITYNDMAFYDVTAPVLDCSALNVTHNNLAGSCSWTFQNLGKPIMTDNCKNRIANYSNNHNGGNNASGQYPVGVTTVVWSATDYMGNTGTCSHTVTVTDNEAPFFNQTPTTLTLTALPDDCGQYISGTSHDVIASDNCTQLNVTVRADIDYGDDGGGTSWDVPNLTTLDDPGLDREFPEGASRVRWIAADSLGNSDTLTFLVVVEDHTAPVFSTVAEVSLSNSQDSCAANDNIPYPDAATYCVDNCSGSDSITIKFIRRSDGLPLNDPFPVGTTTIYWEADDKGVPVNKAQSTQKITVTDIQNPDLTPQSNTKITACEINGHRLVIPESDDNCQVDTLIVNVTDGVSYQYGDTITVAGFNPNGNGLTGYIPTLSENTNYTITWRAIDHSGNDSTISNTLRVELQPTFPLDSVYHADLTCGGTASGRIVINGVNAEGGATVEYSITGGSTWQPGNNTFTGLSGGSYGVVVRVNGCSSEIVQVDILEPDGYSLNGVITQPYCAEGADGAIDIIMTRGSSQQQLFTGSGATVNSYSFIEGASSGMVEAWVYLTAENLSSAIISKNGSYSLGFLNGRFFLSVTGEGKTSYIGSSPTDGVGAKPITEKWYHVAASWVAGGGISLYIDGALATGTLYNGPVPIVDNNANDLVIGSGFYGVIREARVWNADYTTVYALMGDDPGHVQVTGGEAILGGCWPLTDGLAVSANEFLGSGATVHDTWINNMPQPGTYHWVRQEDGWPADSTNLSGLTVGTYVLSFRDIYDCPEPPGLQQTFYLIASDNQPPSIEYKSDVVLDADAGECYHRILAPDTLTLLPVIVNDDGYDCAWTTTWDVFSFSTNSGLTGANSLVGYDLQLGQNLITVYVTQNNYVNTSSFNVYIEDKEKPEVLAQVLTDIVLNGEVGNGNVSVAAEDFNDGSSDNCTNPTNLLFEVSRDGGITFNDSVNFTCADITSSVGIILKAWDESLNDGVSSEFTMTVSDKTSPVFLQPARDYDGNCATANDAYGVGYVTGIDGLYLLPGIDYGDNCAVDYIEFRILHTTNTAYNYPTDGSWIEGYDLSTGYTFHEGVSEVVFRIWDTSGNVSLETVMLRVTVLEMPSPGGVGGN